MRVEKLHLQDFGQFHEKDITLTPGINVVYGANEAGKSTTRDFIVDMFYGIEKATGVGARFDHYEQKRPINRSSYKGSMEVSVDGVDYLVERNFAIGEKSTKVRNLDEGRDIPLKEENNLIGTLLSTDKSTYMNTLCFGQMTAATDKDITDKLNDYIVNMASTKSGDVDAVAAIMELKKKKEVFSVAELKAKEAELSEKLALDRDFDAEIAAVKEEYAKVEADMKNPQKELEFTPIKTAQMQERDAEEEERKAYEETEEPMTKREKDIKMLRNMGPKSVLDNPIVILLLAVIMVGVFVGVAYAVPMVSPQVKMGIMAFGVVLAFLTTVQVFVRRSKLYRLLEEIEIEQGFEEAKAGSADMDVQREYANRLAELRVKEQDIIKERDGQGESMEELTKLKAQIEANEIELAALDMAIKTIQDLSDEIYESFGGILNDQVSKIISKITNNKYTEVKIDDQLHVMVKSGNSYISMDYLSTGTIEQIYLALRLSIADLLISEEMPIIMDDTFITYDYQRLKETLSCLGEYLNRQIIIFSTNPGIHDIFTSLGVQSNYISL